MTARPSNCPTGSCWVAESYGRGVALFTFTHVIGGFVSGALIGAAVMVWWLIERAEVAPAAVGCVYEACLAEGQP